MADPGKIFLALKSGTRRKILEMLAAEPMYLTQLADNLALGQQAIFRHLQLLEEAGLLESDFQDSGQGAPRRYYQIARAVRVEVQISPEMFDVGLFDVPKIEVQIPSDYPLLADVVIQYNELAKQPHSNQKLLAYSELLKKLGSELEKINTNKSIAEATYSNIRLQIRTLSYELHPEQINQRIIQTLAARGGELEIPVLALILNLSEEVLFERLQELEKHQYININKKRVYLL